MYEFREVDRSLISKWDDIVFSLPGGTIFHTLKWLKIIKDNQALDIRNIGIFLDGELVGILPLCLKRFLFIKVAGSPFVVEDTPYMGPVMDSSHIVDLLPALDSYMRKKGINYLRIISNQAYDVRSIYDTYHFIDKHTHILDITKTEDELWKGLEDRCRSHIRKAKKSVVVANSVIDRNFIEKYYSLIEHVYHAQDMPCPNQEGFYYDIWDSFGQSNVIFLSAEYSGEVIAGTIIILDRKSAYYLNGASKQEFRSLSASNLLLWEAIRITKEKGAEQFDFVGSDIPRLAEFKKSFGGQLVTYSLIEKSSSKWVTSFRNKYPIYRRKVGNIREKLKSVLK